MSTTLKWLLSILGVVVVGGGAFMAGQWYEQKMIDKYKVSTPTSTPETSDESDQTSEGTPKVVDEYAGWKTYTNQAIGYTLRYPSDWIVKEINEFSELLGENVKHITISTHDDKYFLDFGLKKTTDTFRISDRTGVGAGDFAAVGTITILDTSVDITKLTYGGKIKEYFYPKAGAVTKTTDGKWQFVAGFSYNSTKVNYDTLDMTGLDSVKTVEKILKSVKLL